MIGPTRSYCLVDEQAFFAQPKLFVLTLERRRIAANKEATAVHAMRRKHGID